MLEQSGRTKVKSATANIGPYTITKIVASNVLIFLVLLAIIELALVGYFQVRCLASERCTDPYPKPLSEPMMREVQKFMQVHPYHPELGYLPKAGVSVVLEPGRFRPNMTEININADGFRSNRNGFEEQPRDILALGDSFTFGIEVSDHQSWPACLESSLNRRVDNAGVPGYGTAQALKRGQLEFDTAEYNTVILSTLVGADFERDRMHFFHGLPSTVLIENGGNLEWAKVPGKMDYVGTRYRPYAPSTLGHFIYYRTILGSQIWERSGAMLPRSPMHLAKHHPEAASKDVIIEKTLTDLAHVDAARKILLLQYVDINSVNDPKLIEEGLRERELILTLSEALDIEVVDTFDSFRAYDPADIWTAHHTPFGNQVVCEELVKQFKRVN